MGSGLTFSTFQVSLVKEGDAFAQRIDVQGGVGSGEPQISGITIRAMKGNGGILYIGGSAAEAAAAEGFELTAGDALSLDITGTGNIWMSGTKSGDRLCVAGVGP
jgi:hypothetical protein